MICHVICLVCVQVFHQIFLHLVGNIFAFQEGNIFAFQEANFVSTVKPMFSDVGDTNISATMFLTFDEGFSLKKNI